MFNPVASAIKIKVFLIKDVLLYEACGQGIIKITAIAISTEHLRHIIF